MGSFLLAHAAMIALGGASIAQVSDERIAEVIASSARPMALDGWRLEGPGAETLIEACAAASFVCLGESHLNEETPRLTGALLAALRPHGYRAFAIETGPMIAEYAEEKFKTGREDELARLFADVPFSAAFIDHEPEFSLLDRAVDLGYDLWGLDQVFIGGARFNLMRLQDLAPDESARAAATVALDRAMGGFLKFTQTGDSSAGFLASADDADYERLRRAFRGVDEAQRIIDELHQSGTVYRLFMEGANYESNHRRIQLMKRHLVERLRQAAPETKVLMKFGSMHMGRGYSELNQLDLGAAASELGILRGGGSLHVKVTALSSRARDGSVSDWVAESPVLAHFEDAMPEDASWALFDLRPLRPIFHRERNVTGREGLADLVWRYDMVVVAREFGRAAPLPGVPSPPQG